MPPKSADDEFALLRLACSFAAFTSLVRLKLRRPPTLTNEDPRGRASEAAVPDVGAGDVMSTALPSAISLEAQDARSSTSQSSDSLRE
jgi:hypothetical protein